MEFNLNMDQVSPPVVYPSSVPLSYTTRINQPHYQTQHQYAPVKDLGEPVEIEHDGFDLKNRVRGLWSFDCQIADDEFVGYVECEVDGMFSLHVTHSNRVIQLTYWRFDHLKQAMHNEYLIWVAVRNGVQS